MLMTPVTAPFPVDPCSASWLPAAVPGFDSPCGPPTGQRRAGPRAAVDPDDEEDLGDEEDLAVAQPLADEESSFDDFDDEFDDDFEEEENDPDWDHPDDDNDEPPPGKGAGGKK
jgi:hypothetical protein